MGSQAYGVSDDASDLDIYGVCIPPKAVLFPHTIGSIPGFGPPEDHPRFNQWSEHHVKFEGREYDFSVFGINRYFQLCIENNPNMIDSLYTPRECVLHSTRIGEVIRANRDRFLHKGVYKTFMGYSRAQWAKIKSGTNSSNPKRAASIAEHGFDVKFAYHLVRLQLECRDILRDGTPNLGAHANILRGIREGGWTLNGLELHMSEMEKELTCLYESCSLPDHPDYEGVKKILVECLEIHYGDLSSLMKVESNDAAVEALDKISAIMRKYGAENAR